MGQSTSKEQTLPIQPTETSANLDDKVVAALRLVRQQKEKAGKKIDPFNKIMLKFPQIEAAFNSARETFNAFDTNKKGYINHSDLEEAFKRLGADFAQEELNEIFKESDMTHTGQLSFKEFLVCLAIGFVLHRIPSLEEGSMSIFYGPLSSASPRTRGSCLFGHGNNLRIAFQSAIDCFLWFDVDGNGTIQRDEMGARLQAAMHCYSPTKKMSNHTKQTFSKAEIMTTSPMTSFISDRRFNEMDWDHDGNITFKEFLLAFESWVGIEDDTSSFMSPRNAAANTESMDTEEVVN